MVYAIWRSYYLCEYVNRITYRVCKVYMAIVCVIYMCVCTSCFCVLSSVCAGVVGLQMPCYCLFGVYVQVVSVF
jgi:hypothetical protein